MSIIFSPIIIPDLFSFKTAFEYKLNDKINLIIPVEAKYMNYSRFFSWLIKKNSPDFNFPDDLYNKSIRLNWNLDYSQLKLSSGVGIKYFLAGKSMHSAFFVKNIFLISYERFNAFSQESIKHAAALGTALTLGYNWVVNQAFVCGLELGAEYDYHINPIKKLPILWKGFSPVFQINLGFNI